MSTQKQNNNEEVDLGSLFTVIGNGFKNVFNFFKGLINGVFHNLIMVLIFFKTHFLKFFIAIVVGGAIGAFLEYESEDKYGSNLLVQPNFNTTKQLYKNINYFNDLVKQEKLEQIASVFNIDTIKAKKFRKFEINPVINNNDIINAYDKFILASDTLTVQNYAFDEFQSNFTDYDYEIHDIEVEASVNDIFDGLEIVILKSVESNPFFNKIKKLTAENLKRSDSLYRENLKSVDSIRQVYMKVMLDEANKQSTGTSIDLGGNKQSTKEIELFDASKKIMFDLKLTYEQIAEESDVINIVSNFQTIGYEVKGITKNLIFIMAGLSFLLTLFLILLFDLNKFLEGYKK